MAYIFYTEAHVIYPPALNPLTLSPDVVPWEVPHKQNIRHYIKQMAAEITTLGLQHWNNYTEFRKSELVNIRKTGYLYLPSERKAKR